MGNRYPWCNSNHNTDGILQRTLHGFIRRRTQSRRRHESRKIQPPAHSPRCAQRLNFHAHHRRTADRSSHGHPCSHRHADSKKFQTDINLFSHLLTHISHEWPDNFLLLRPRQWWNNSSYGAHDFLYLPHSKKTPQKLSRFTLRFLVSCPPTVQSLQSLHFVYHLYLSPK